MHRVIYTLATLLLIAAIVILAISPMISEETFKAYRAALPAGLLIALAGHLFALARAASDRKEKDSRFYLDSCILAYEQAQELLIDGNNDRAAWIAAGRALAHADELEGFISEKTHKRVLEVQKLKFRGFFDDVLTKPASFFYGVDPDLSIDDAAKASTKRSGTTVSTMRYLSDKSLVRIWQAAQWPSDYKDPLDRGFSKDETGRLIVLYPGLSEYLEHQDRWTSVAGKLHENPRNNDS